MGLDSVELIMSVENHFNVIFSEKDIIKTRTIGDLTDLVCQYRYIKDSSAPEFDTVYNQLKDLWNSNLKLDELVTTYLPINQRIDFQHEFQYLIPKHSSEGSNALKRWLNFYLIEWEKLTIEQFINTVIIYNENSFFKEEIPTTNYGIYVVTARIIYDRIGCPYYDLQPTSHIVNDLRID